MLCRRPKCARATGTGSSQPSRLACGTDLKVNAGPPSSTRATRSENVPPPFHVGAAVGILLKARPSYKRTLDQLGLNFAARFVGLLLVVPKLL